MSYLVPDVIGGPNGGPAKLLADPGRARNIHVTLSNNTSSSTPVFFANSRRELLNTVGGNVGGFAVVSIGTGELGTSQAPNPQVGSLTGPPTQVYTSLILRGWVGELWVVAGKAVGVVVWYSEGAATER